MSSAPTGEEIAQDALKYQGVPYVWGGNSLTSGVDCSGLVQQVFKQYGINLPRTTYDQINVGASVQMKNLQAGDLVFFNTDPSRNGPDHVGIYIGGGKFIAAPKPGEGVKISSLTDSYYASRFDGARRIPGVATDDAQTATVGEFSQAAVPPDKDTLASQYGMSYAFFQSADPEIKSLFQEAVKNTWSAAVFQAHLQNTDWWKDNSDTVRQSQVLAKTDPATFNANMAAAQAQASQEATQMGAILSTAQLKKLATNIVSLGWNTDQVQNFLGQYVAFNAQHVIGGQGGQIYNQLTSYAQQMGVSLSDNTIKTYAQYVSRGVSDLTGIMNQIKQQAAGAYPAFSKQIASGATVSSLVDPYVQTMAQELNIDPDSLNAQTPLIKQAIGRTDQNGNPAPMSLTDFQTQVRQQPGWTSTPQAQGSLMQVGHSVLQNMGLVS